MTKTEMIDLVNHYGAENLVTIVFDNSLIINFVGKEKFNVSCIKTIGGVDVVELKYLKARNKTTGAYDIAMTTVHPIDMVQCLGFCDNPKDIQNIDKQTFHNL